MVRRRSAIKMPTPAIAASNKVEGSGTAAGAPAKAAAGANAAEPPSDEDDDEPNVLPSTASRPEPSSGDVPLDDQTDDDGNAASTRSSNKLTSKPGSVVARRSIAAMRFSSCLPFALLIEPEAIAA